MIAKKSDELRKASDALYIMNADQMIRERCRAREDYYRIQNTMNYKLEKVTAEKEELASENKQLTSENKQLISENKALASEIEELKERLLKQGISDKNK